MKQIKLTEPGKLIIADVKEPQISKPDDVKIKVAYSAINMEDISFFNQDLNRLLWSSPVGTIGHEFSGVVVVCRPGCRGKRFFPRHQGDRDHLQILRHMFLLYGCKRKPLL